MPADQLLVVPAEPGPFRFDPAHTALVLIDMQRDFIEPGGFGETLGNDVSLLQAVIPPLQQVLAATRAAGMTVITSLVSPASPPKSACTPPSGRPTTAAMSVWCSPTASAPAAELD